MVCLTLKCTLALVRLQEVNRWLLWYRDVEKLLRGCWTLCETAILGTQKKVVKIGIFLLTQINSRDEINVQPFKDMQSYNSSGDLQEKSNVVRACV